MFWHEMKQVFAAVAQLYCSFNMISTDRVAFSATITLIMHTQSQATHKDKHTHAKTMAC